MNITQISTNENSFKGMLTVKDFKANKLLQYNTTKEVAEQIKETFSGTKMLNTRKSPFAGTPATKLLAKLKEFVTFFSNSVGANFNKELTYPEVSKFAAEYKVTQNSAEINVPEHFSIRLDI